MIGLAGSHRTGKTTLAKAFAEEFEIPFAETSSSAVFKELGLDPKADYDLKVRMLTQNIILESAIGVYKAAGSNFITDRTPIDMLAYTLADIRRENVTEYESHLVADYMKRCIEVTNEHFQILCVIQPGIPIVEDPGKAPANIAYMEHINALVKGLVMHDDIHAYRLNMRRKMTNINVRIDALMTTVHRFYEKHAVVPDNYVFH